MGVAWEHVDGLNVVAVNFPFEDFAFGVVEVALLNKAVAFDDNELLKLGVVPVLTLGDAGLADVDADLACVEGMNQLGEAAAVIDIHLQREGSLLIGQVAEVGAVELLGKAVGRNLGYHQGLWLFCEGLKKLNNLAQSYLVCHRTVAVTTAHRVFSFFCHTETTEITEIVFCWRSLFCVFRAFCVTILILCGDDFEAVELAAVLVAFEGSKHLVYEVVDVEEFQLDAGVIDGIGQVVGKGIAEGGYGAVVVGTAPLAEEVREAINQDARFTAHGLLSFFIHTEITDITDFFFRLCWRSLFCGFCGFCVTFKELTFVVEEEVFTGFFAAAVFGVAETACEGGLLTRREHDGAFVAMLLQGVEQGAGKAEVALHELLLVLGAVDACEVEDEVAVAAPLVELLMCAIKVVLIDCLDGNGRMGLVLACLYVLQCPAEVLAYETLGTGN